MFNVLYGCVCMLHCKCLCGRVHPHSICSHEHLWQWAFYSASGKYSQHFTFSTFCHVTGLLQNYTHNTPCRSSEKKLCLLDLFIYTNKKQKYNIRTYSQPLFNTWSAFGSNYSVQCIAHLKLVFHQVGWRALESTCSKLS